MARIPRSARPGSNGSEILREPFEKGSESPQHEVTIKHPFAVGKFAVTVRQFAAFADATGRDARRCSTIENGKHEEREDRSFRNPGFSQEDTHPVVCMSWADAEAYAGWLSQKTGKPYRLLTEAEREYVARAGTQTAFWWGGDISSDRANYDGNVLYKPGALSERQSQNGRYRRRTVPVDSFGPNPWGLFNVHGNVLEWVEDCWHRNYQGAPVDGSAWLDGDCNNRVARGGSWPQIPELARSAYRSWDYLGYRYSNVGFRVARTLDQH